jgi:hypothetical protein
MSYIFTTGNAPIGEFHPVMKSVKKLALEEFLTGNFFSTR